MANVVSVISPPLWWPWQWHPQTLPHLLSQLFVTHLGVALLFISGVQSCHQGPTGGGKDQQPALPVFLLDVHSPQDKHWKKHLADHQLAAVSTWPTSRWRQEAYQASRPCQTLWHYNTGNIVCFTWLYDLCHIKKIVTHWYYNWTVVVRLDS